MKKIMYLCVAFSMLLFACGGNNKNSDTASEENSYESTIDEVETYPPSVPDSETTVEEQSDSAEESNNSDWNPVGTYKMEDANGTPYTLVLKKGGNAELINNRYDDNSEYKPSKGSWSNSNKGYVSLNFFSGPFIKIASHDYVQSPVLTSEFFYYDKDAYDSDSDCLEVQKVD